MIASVESEAGPVDAAFRTARSLESRGGYRVVREQNHPHISPASRTKRMRFFPHPTTKGSTGLLKHWLPVALLILGAGRGDDCAAAAASEGGMRPAPAVAAAPAVNVLTYHNDLARTGQNLQEVILTPANVNPAGFGKVGFYPTDGQVYAQPLYLSHQTVAGAGHNVLYVATEHDSVYAFDADTGAVLWQTSLLGAGEAPSDDRGCGQIAPEIGVTATPVIDPGAGPRGTLYVVGMSKDRASHYHQRLHALDVITGAEMPGSPADIQAECPGSGENSIHGRLVFDPAQYKERTGLLLLHGVIYTCWASHCDHPPYNGWIIGYDARTLARVAVLNLTPNGTEGAVWASGAAPAADADGSIYLLAGNGTFETELDARGFPRRQDFGNAFLRLSTAGGQLAVADYFTMKNVVWESSVDWDLGSGGVLRLPDCTDADGRVRRLAIGAGKDQTIYVVDCDRLGGFHADRNDIHQELTGALAGQEYGMPAYFNGTVYYGAMTDAIRAYPVIQARLAATPSSQTKNKFTYPGTTPGISAHGATHGIVWAIEWRDPAVLHAYDARDLARELYDSNQPPNGRDQFGPGIKFATPTIANGRVFVGAATGVAVFGLRP
jgi:outer membrane protein assembly factor BamB